MAKGDIMGDEEEELNEKVGASEEEQEIAEGPETEEELEEPGDSESVASETEDDDDGDPVPYKRFSKVYGEMKTTTEKFDLFKRLGPDDYYNVYPDEKPEEVKEVPEAPVSISEAANMVINGGPYDGKTLGQVAETDPLSAMAMYDEYRADQRKQIEDDNRLKTESETEETNFKSEQAKELFNREYSNLTAIEQGKIDGVISSALGWMESTGRGGGNLFDAHYLMNREAELSAAKGTAAASAVEAIGKGAVQSISGRKGDVQTGLGAYVNLTRDQLADKLEAMSESERSTFYEKAPANLKAKFPDLPW